MNRLLFDLNHEIERLKRIKNPTKEELETLGAISKIYSDLVQYHKMEVEKQNIDAAQSRLLKDTQRFIEDSWRVQKLYEDAYKEVMMIAVRRLNHELNQRI